jgi:hypothetical protein
MGAPSATSHVHAAGSADLGTHLQMVQAVVSRMGQNAFAVKTWSVTVIAAVFAFAPSDPSARLGLWMVLVPTAAFWWLDAYYLRQERLFRMLYAKIVAGGVAPYSMDAAAFVNEVAGVPRIAFAGSVWPVHVVALLAIALKACVAQGLISWR